MLNMNAEEKDKRSMRDQFVFGTICLAHFCEIHGPTVVFTTQMVPPSSQVYTFPPTFMAQRRSLPTLLQDLRRGRACSIKNSSNASSSSSIASPSPGSSLNSPLSSSSSSSSMNSSHFSPSVSSSSSSYSHLDQNNNNNNNALHHSMLHNNPSLHLLSPLSLSSNSSSTLLTPTLTFSFPDSPHLEEDSTVSIENVITINPSMKENERNQSDHLPSPSKGNLSAALKEHEEKQSNRENQSESKDNEAEEANRLEAEEKEEKIEEKVENRGENESSSNGNITPSESIEMNSGRSAKKPMVITLSTSYKDVSATPPPNFLRKETKTEKQSVSTPNLRLSTSRDPFQSSNSSNDLSSKEWKDFEEKKLQRMRIKRVLFRDGDEKEEDDKEKEENESNLNHSNDENEEKMCDSLVGSLTDTSIPLSSLSLKEETPKKSEETKENEENNNEELERSIIPSVEIIVKPAEQLSSLSASSCASCSSIADANGLFSLSQDDSNEKDENSNETMRQNGWFFISTRFPVPQNYAAVRNACLRSLSCEFVPGREGPVLFGSSEASGESGSSSSNEWTISYSFKLADSKARGSQRQYSFLFLLSDHSRLVSSMDFIIRFFKSIANSMQEKAAELMQKEIQTNSNNASSYRAPVRTLGLRREAGGHATARSLRELLSDENCFVNMHTKFCWLLTNVEKGVIMSIPTHQLHNVDRLAKETKAVLQSSKAFSATFATWASLFRESRILETYRTIIYHLLIGTQIIIKTHLPFLATSLIDLLRKALPEPCLRIIPFSDKYHESWECNLLGVPMDVVLPDHLDPSTIAIVEVIVDPYFSPGGSDTLSIQVRATPPGKTSLGNELERTPMMKLPPELESLRIQDLKQEWISKARLFYRLSPHLQSDSDPKIRKFETTLKLVHEDMKIIKFWAKSLRRQFARESKSVFSSQKS
eukprot:TRINITY_DN145_c2_g1_i1.p1 TRINITY_DN145_c2_g1~~TRINITY_DN145_c2_g1_i1.p1  ORF type:complete len:934 (-),score=436.95 TRINITY_DN145_c2_g1_i1:36-2837(-)